MKLFKNQSSQENSLAQTQDFGDVHTPSNPYCPDLNCSCHDNSQYHDQIHHGRTTNERSHRFFNETGYHDRMPAHSSHEEEQAFSFFGIGRHGGR